MRNIILTIFVGLGIIGLFAGCSVKKNDKVQIDELNRINDKIIAYFQTNTMEGYSYNYVDVGKMKVVVGLTDNSEEKRQEFKDKIIDSEYIMFIDADENVNY